MNRDTEHLISGQIKHESLPRAGRLFGANNLQTKSSRTTHLLLEAAKAKLLLIQPFQDVESQWGQEKYQGDEESREDFQLVPDFAEEGQLFQIAVGAVHSN